ncbi:transcriptional regulator, BadM/Rrf2 family [Ruminococcaceae bacterium FB2012]|nr:transcriptional regulator, BadM/Rrf2 family [Ruminococcaceae bacterium FB2012]
MKISTKGRYALRLMVDLGLNAEENCCPVREISERQGISEKYLEQIISVLSKAGLVSSVRGAGGGYRLSRDPKQYTVGMLLRATEGSLAPVSCLTEGEPPCERADSCTTLYIWEKIYEAVNNVVDSITLADLIENEKGKRK